MKKDKKVVEINEATDRRALLKGLVAGSAVVTGSKALPDNWVKPMADAVILPGHAQTTIGDYAGGDGRREGDYGYSSDGDGDDKGEFVGDYYEGYTYGDQTTDFDYGEDGSDHNDDADNNVYYD